MTESDGYLKKSVTHCAKQCHGHSCLCLFPSLLSPLSHHAEPKEVLYCPMASVRSQSVSISQPVYYLILSVSRSLCKISVCEYFSACVLSHSVSISQPVLDLILSVSLSLCKISFCQYLSTCVRSHSVSISQPVLDLILSVSLNLC